MNLPASSQTISDFVDDIKGILGGVVRGVLDTVLGAVRYGNWTGYNWSAGQRDLDNLDEPEHRAVEGVDLFDALTKKHDYDYHDAGKDYREAIANGVPENEAKAEYHAAIATADEALAKGAAEVRADSILGEIVRVVSIPFMKAKAFVHKQLSGYYANKDGASVTVEPPNLEHDLGADDQQNDDTGPNDDRSPTPAHDLGSDGNQSDDTGPYDGGDGDSEGGTSTPGHDLGSDGNQSDDTGPYDGSEGGGDSGDSGKPVVLDLDGDGVELVALEDSTAFYDIDGDGYRERVGWVSPDDGLLAYDKNGDGKISGRAELSFVDYVPGARTDLEGLRYFDSNGDGRLDAKDAEWGRFRVWRDLDQDGESDPGELQTLGGGDPFDRSDERRGGPDGGGEPDIRGGELHGRGRPGSALRRGSSLLGVRPARGGGWWSDGFVGGIRAGLPGGDGDGGDPGCDRARGRRVGGPRWSRPPGGGRGRREVARRGRGRGHARRLGRA